MSKIANYKFGAIEIYDGNRLLIESVILRRDAKRALFMIRLIIYHTLHFLTGFIGEPTGHLKSAANSSILDMGPMTRKRPGA